VVDSDDSPQPPAFEERFLDDAEWVPEGLIVETEHLIEEMSHLRVLIDG
jgi:hypothetical protein